MGRVPAFEVMVLDDEARRFVANGEYEQLRGYLRKQKMLWLDEAAWARVVEGVTAVSEIVRVFKKEGPAGASGVNVASGASGTGTGSPIKKAQAP